MNEKIRKNIHIEILKYAHEHGEFLCKGLSVDLVFNQNEKQLFFGKLMHDKTLLQNTGRNQKTDGGEESIFTISTEGRFKLLEFEQLDSANKASTEAMNKIRISICIAISMAVIAIATLMINYFSLKKTQQSLELSTTPEVTIKAVDNGLGENKLQMPGHSQISDSYANFVLKNNFLGELKDFDIKMLILEMHTDQKSKHPVICPFAHVNYTNNPNFKVDEHWRTYSILDNKLYNLKSLEENYFSIDYKNLNPILNNATGTDFFIKIDINYKRAIDSKPFFLTKIYKIHNLISISEKTKELRTEYIVDTDIDKQIITFNDLNNQILTENNYSYPFFAIYPFNESGFVEIVKSNFIPPYSLEPSECEYFELNAKNRIIE